MPNELTIGDISIDCARPEVLREFYKRLTGWRADTLYGCPAIVAENGLVILFMACDFDYAPPVWPEVPGGQQKQMHFNFQAADLSSAVAKALESGAIKPENQYGGDDFVTLLDPEGHPFCICKK